MTQKSGQSSISGYACDHNRIQLGSGRLVFERAVKALKRWHQFELGWVRICTPTTPIEADATVCVLVGDFMPAAELNMLWLLFACRIVYVVDEGGPINKYGFAYGTLPGHPETGEERFCIEWHQRDDSVWYDILAFSRPGTFLVQMGWPFGRFMQSRFAKGSKQAMLLAASKD